MEDGSTVSLGGRPLLFRHTRGHAEHHFCIWDEETRGWFSGDMFGLSYTWWRFPGGDLVVPSTTPSQFDPDTFFASLDILSSHAPSRMYLTHYGELAYCGDLVALLREQVRVYCDLARANATDPVQLEEALGDYSLQLIGRLALDGDEEQWRRSLTFDMRLNAQGLLVWLKRVSA